MRSQTPSQEDADQDAVARDKVDGSEETKEEFVPLQSKLRAMNVGEKIRMALLGNAAARSILVRDPNRVVGHVSDRLSGHG